MLYCYPVIKNKLVYIYEKGETYLGMGKRKVNRMFKDLNWKPLTFTTYIDAQIFCTSRNLL